MTAEHAIKSAMAVRKVTGSELREYMAEHGVNFGTAVLELCDGPDLHDDLVQAALTHCKEWKVLTD